MLDDAFSYDEKFSLYRQQQQGFVDRWVFKQAQEILDLYPESDAASKVIKDLQKFSEYFHLDKTLSDLILKKLQVLPNNCSSSKSLLEICAGNGWLTRKLRRVMPGSQPVTLTASDISSSALLEGRQISDSDDIRWEIADACCLPYDDQQFDLIFCSQALHHFQASKVIMLLKEMSRVGKQVVVFDLRRTFYGWLFVKLFSPFYSKEFIHDGVTSHRRAYNLKEINYLIKDASLPLRARKFLPVGMLIESEN